jgi:hypothetical protein
LTGEMRAKASRIGAEGYESRKESLGMKSTPRLRMAAAANGGYGPAARKAKSSNLSKGGAFSAIASAAGVGVFVGEEFCARTEEQLQVSKRINENLGSLPVVQRSIRT